MAKATIARKAAAHATYFSWCHRSGVDRRRPIGPIVGPQARIPPAQGAGPGTSARSPRARRGDASRRRAAGAGGHSPVPDPAGAATGGPADRCRPRQARRGAPAGRCRARAAVRQRAAGGRAVRARPRPASTSAAGGHRVGKGTKRAAGADARAGRAEAAAHWVEDGRDCGQGTSPARGLFVNQRGHRLGPRDVRRILDRRPPVAYPSPRPPPHLRHPPARRRRRPARRAGAARPRQPADHPGVHAREQGATRSPCTTGPTLGPERLRVAPAG